MVPIDMPQMAAILAKDDPSVSGELLTRLRQEMGLNRADFGRVVGLSERSVARPAFAAKSAAFSNGLRASRKRDHGASVTGSVNGCAGMSCLRRTPSDTRT